MNCPYCNAEIDTSGANRIFCSACGTAHHADCWRENGGCTVFGCSAAPGEGPVVSVGTADVSGALPPQPGPGASPPPQQQAPPPFSTGAAPPPPPAFGGQPGSGGNQYYPGYGPPPPAPPYQAGAYYPPQGGPPGYGPPPKSRLAYILLGVFLGIFGVHNFYAGYVGRGVAQLLITVCTLFIGSLVTWIWAIVEVCTVDKDSRNVYMV